MAVGSSISRGRNKRRVETVEISSRETSPIGKVKKVEPPPSPICVLPSPPHSPPAKKKRMISVIHVDSDDEEENDLLYSRQLEEALMASLINASSKNNNNNAASSSSTPDQSTQTSEETHLLCGICMDNKASSEMFRNEKVCSHLFCLECIGSYVSTKIKENIAKVTCPEPNCKGLIGPELCRSFVPKQVVERWEDALCESLIPGTEKFYCPFKDCSAMLVDDGGQAVTSSECPNCNRLFCAQCKVSWHSGMDCTKFKNLNKGESNREDEMLMNLAKKKRWRRCPKCNFFVEKISGCDSIHCRCGNSFSYTYGHQEDDTFIKKMLLKEKKEQTSIMKKLEEISIMEKLSEVAKRIQSINSSNRFSHG